MTQRTDYAVEIHEDEEGWYDATITLPDGSLVVIDPRMVRIVKDEA